MLPYFRISSTESISLYNLMAAFGLIAAILFFYALSKKNKIPVKIVDNMSLLFVLIILMAALMAILLNNLEHNCWDFSSPKSFISGFTFYGGLLGGALVALPGCFLIGRKENLCLVLLDQLTVSITIGHSIGRIGCFLGGCCYGKQTTSFLGIPYPVNGAWMSVYPVQLYESLFLLLLFLFSFRHISHSLERYFVLYGVFRFFIEFLRGDNRGICLFLSPSQWISICLVTLGISIYMLRNRKNPVTHPSE